MRTIGSGITTAIESFGGTALSVLVMGLCAFSFSRPNFKFKKALTVYIFITMIFSGGLIPSYIINTQYLKLGNTIWAYILPSLVGGEGVMIFNVLRDFIVATCA